MNIQKLIAMYKNMAIKMGLNSDQAVVLAWQNDPSTYADIFSLRMNILRLLENV